MLITKFIHLFISFYHHQKVDGPVGRALENLEISQCKSLTIKIQSKENLVIIDEENQDNLTLDINPETSFLVQDVERLRFIVPSEGLELEKVTFNNVTEVTSVFERNNLPSIIDWMGITYENFYFYLVIALASILVICVLIVIPTIIGCHK